MTVAKMNQLRTMTLEEYLNSPEEERIELIDGVVYDLAVPSDAHQRVVGELYGQLWMYLRGKRCSVRVSPYNVFLGNNARRPNVVQPDITVVCDPKKIQKDGCHGAPDMVIEVVSPNNRRRDVLEKMRLYRSNGVKEYWMVYPEEAYITIDYYSEDGTKRSESYGHEEQVKVGILEDCVINLTTVFPEIEA